MRIAILGGSFNPVHIGHLFLADAVISALKYDRVILVPAFQSPFKPGAEGAPPGDRLDMLLASIAGDPRLNVDDCEVRRQGVSYTIDTIEEIKHRYHSEGKPGLILGDDLAAAFSKWKRASDIAQEADIIMARRLFNSANLGDSAPVNPDKTAGSDEIFPYPHTSLNNELINISSQLVREKIRLGENWRYLVPQGARQIIEERFLYGYRGNGETLKNGISPETIAFLESIARNTLNTSRFLHSRNTALMAWDLCIRYGLDPRSGYLAGVTHDICKSAKEDELVAMISSDGGEMSDLEKRKPGLLHGRAAAILLRDRYGITDTQILNAVSCHVTCGNDMGDLAKVIYIADKLEFSREHAAPHLRQMLNQERFDDDCRRKADLDELFTSVLGETVAFLRSSNKDISLSALRLLSAMEKKKT